VGQDEESSFGELLRRYRVAAGLSQEALAERAGLSRRGIADLERGARHFPFGDTVRRLAEALALEPTDRAALLSAAHRPTPPANQRAAEPARTRAGALPLRRAELIGRDAELEQLHERVLRADGRLVTLTGSGILLEALAPLRRAGDVYQLVEALVNVGGIELELAAVEAAAQLTSEGLVLLRDSGLQFFLPEALELAAELAATRREAEGAAQLFGAAELARERTGAVRYATADAGYLHAREGVRSALPAAVFAQTWADGRALAPQAAVELALATVRFSSPTPDVDAGEPLAKLTPREREVALLIANGRTNRQIAEALVIAEGTAAVHVNHILAKLGCTSRARVAALVGTMH
jgi:DNA-binding NarL/FixJ family response regulator/DNA-binding XRE family transcriptional regulator